MVREDVARDARSAAAAVPVATPSGRAIADVGGTFLRLGVTSFGGPVAHLGFFQRTIVAERGWVTPASYAALLGLCQVLPGPASSQLAVLLGYQRGGGWGGVAAILGFALPSIALMAMAGAGMAMLPPTALAPWLAGLAPVVAAVIAQALWALSRRLCPDAARIAIAVGVAVAALVLPPGWAPLALVPAALVGAWLPATGVEAGLTALLPRVPGITTSVLLATIAVAGVVVLPLAAHATASPSLHLAAGLWRSGLLVFGGGHVVLPLLQATVVTPGLVSESHFIAGYGFAQAVPGPLFTIGAYCGAAMPHPNLLLAFARAALGVSCLMAPGLLLALATVRILPAIVRAQRYARMLHGVNAGVVGLLGAAWAWPLLAGILAERARLVAALIAWLLLAVVRLPPAVVVLVGIVGGALAVHAGLLAAGLPGS